MNASHLFLFVAMFAPSTHAETPKQFAERFYRGYFHWKIRGVPTETERNRVSLFLSSEILSLYKVANQLRIDEERRYPIDPKHPELALKPYWSKEGDPFSNSYEGISTFAIGLVTRFEGRIAVQAHLEYIEGTKAYPWTDTLVLDRAGSEWVVADIRFAGGSPLVATLRDAIRKFQRDPSIHSK